MSPRGSFGACAPAAVAGFQIIIFPLLVILSTASSGPVTARKKLRSVETKKKNDLGARKVSEGVIRRHSSSNPYTKENYYKTGGDHTPAANNRSSQHGALVGPLSGGNERSPATNAAQKDAIPAHEGTVIAFGGEAESNKDGEKENDTGEVLQNREDKRLVGPLPGGYACPSEERMKLRGTTRENERGVSRFFERPFVPRTRRSESPPLGHADPRDAVHLRNNRLSQTEQVGCSLESCWPRRG
jgi:hypothetical protein